ncbi:MAG: hypothetical protein IPG63_19690 [Xanthomonadales bacterium]|nr:hypothetical protein [Xanthomonadales bacterium]
MFSTITPDANQRDANRKPLLGIDVGLERRSVPRGQPPPGHVICEQPQGAEEHAGKRLHDPDRARELHRIGLCEKKLPDHAGHGRHQVTGCNQTQADGQNRVGIGSRHHMVLPGVHRSRSAPASGSTAVEDCGGLEQMAQLALRELATLPAACGL